MEYRELITGKRNIGDDKEVVMFCLFYFVCVCVCVCVWGGGGVVKMFGQGGLSKGSSEQGR